MKGFGDVRKEFFADSGLGAAQHHFDLASHLFDGVKIRRVCGQEKDAGSGVGDQREGVLVLVRTQVVMMRMSPAYGLGPSAYLQ